MYAPTLAKVSSHHPHISQVNFEVKWVTLIFFLTCPKTNTYLIPRSTLPPEHTFITVNAKLEAFVSTVQQCFWKNVSTSSQALSFKNFLSVGKWEIGLGKHTFNIENCPQWKHRVVILSLLLCFLCVHSRIPLSWAQGPLCYV